MGAAGVHSGPAGTAPLRALVVEGWLIVQSCDRLGGRAGAGDAPEHCDDSDLQAV